VRLLLDTCTFLWLASEPARLSQRATACLADSRNEVLLSSVSAWEISVKYEIGKLSLDRPPERFVLDERRRHFVDCLTLDEESALYVHRLPPHHRDPFDRMLVCQAIVGGLTLVTPDPEIARYPVRTLW